MIPANSPGDTLGTVIREGQVFLKYRVSKGETIYGIARQFELTRRLLEETNPELRQGLKAEMHLFIPVASRPIQGEETEVPLELGTAPKPSPTVSGEETESILEDMKGYKVLRSDEVLELKREYSE